MNLPEKVLAQQNSSSTEPCLLAEGIPENLGCEWRILCPFEIPGVRFPADNTPPNQRRLPENDTLVELIQTTEYLEETPTWGQRYYQLYPPRYGNPFYRGRGKEAEEEVEGEENDSVKDHSERGTNRGFRRGSSHENGRGNRRGFHSQISSEKDQGDRQEEEWSIPASVGRRGGDAFLFLPLQNENHHTELHPLLLPLRIDFLEIGVASGMGSPLVRTPPQIVQVRERGQDINQPAAQRTQPGSEPAQIWSYRKFPLRRSYCFCS